MSTSTFWLVIIAVGLGTYAMRTVPLLLHGRLRMPPSIERLLRHVPAAALAALIVPASLLVRTDGAYDVAPERVIALAIAVVVALKWRNMLATLVVGMVALWVMQTIL